METTIFVKAKEDFRIELTDERLIEISFREINSKGEHSYVRFALRPHELKSACSTYLNSIPNQEEIFREVPTPFNMMDNRNNIEIFIEEINIALKKEPIRGIREHGFLRGADTKNALAVTNSLPETLFWYKDIDLEKDPHYISIGKYANCFMKMGAVHDFIEHLKRIING